MINKYRKKPVEIEAIQWDGTLERYKEIQAFTDNKVILFEETQSLLVPTLEGDHIGGIGDWIIKGIVGEFYPCKDLVFQKSYELVGDGR